MPNIGIRELKARASEIIRHVRDQRARYTITHRGRPVGLLLPLDEPHATPPALGNDTEDAWDTLTRLGKEIGRDWKSPLTSSELLSDMRR